jgi:hypothetical protein
MEKEIAMGSKATKAKTASRPRSKGRGAKAKAKPTGAKAGGNRQGGKERLRPGQLDGLVLAYMKKHKGELPVTATKVAGAIKRSSGAVGNCLVRLEEAEKVRLTEKKPRRYGLSVK